MWLYMYAERENMLIEQLYYALIRRFCLNLDSIL